MNAVYFGSAFNPVHNGHIQCIRDLTENFELVLIGPSAGHPFGKKMNSFDVRMNHLMKMIGFNKLLEKVQVTDIEFIMYDGIKPVYTYDVLDMLKQTYNLNSLKFAIGPDNVENFHKFYNYQKIIQEFGIYQLEEKVKYRSTQLRTALKEEDRQKIKEMTNSSMVELMLNDYKDFLC